MTSSTDDSVSYGKFLQQQAHETIEQLPKLTWGDTFKFDCHKGVRCWTACCGNLHLFLTPYDIIRLKRRLGLKSYEFHEKYTTVNIDPSFGLPATLLNMKKEDGRCPFVAPDGCSIYSDRPTSCRLYPFGQGASSGTANTNSQKIFFKIVEDHCKGWEEDKSWRLEDWVIDQGANDYNMYNEMVVRMTFNPKLDDPSKLPESKIGMIFMALYDLDRFREFVFNSTLLAKFDVEQDVIEKIKEFDEDLMRFGMKWIEFSVMNLPVFHVKGKTPTEEI